LPLPIPLRLPVAGREAGQPLESDNPGSTMAFDRNYKDSRILVTGGAGFIESHLSERLLAAGAEVVCADNYFTDGLKETIA
jgi:3-oxoacyl-ACP reductase-like protein